MESALKMESVSVAEIIELAVAIFSSSFEWHGLELECDVGRMGCLIL